MLNLEPRLYVDPAILERERELIFMRGFRNVCRQRGAQLLEDGTGRCGAIRCPYPMGLR